MQLHELCELIVDCEHKTAPIQATGYPSIRTPNIGRGFFLLDGVNRVSEETYRLWTRRAVPRAGDLIMAREAPVGNVAVIRNGLRPCLGQRTLLIRPDQSKIDPAYLTYWLIAPDAQAAIHSLTNGATVPHLNMEDVRTLPIPSLPSMANQRRIAGTLSAYDNLIATNLRRIKILEEMARALYREWFEELRFPGADKGRLVASPLGPIPQDWRVATLGEVATELRRNIAKGNLGGERPFVGLEHIPRRALALDAWDTVSAVGSNKLAFTKGDVLFGKIRPYFHKVSVAPFEGVCSADTIVINSRRPENYAVVVACVSSDAFVAYATATSNGSKMPRATWSVMSEYKLVIPTGDVATRFSALLTSAIALQQVLVFQNVNLRQTRDLLLPRLMSGKLSLGETD